MSRDTARRNARATRAQIFKKLALKYLCDVRQELKDEIVREIEGG